MALGFLIKCRLIKLRKKAIGKLNAHLKSNSSLSPRPFSAVISSEPRVCDASDQAVPSRYVGARSHAEPDHAATRLRAQTLRAAGELQTTSEVPFY